MNNDDTDFKIKLDTAAARLRQMQMEYRIASHRLYSPGGKEAFKKLHHSHELETLLSELSPPHSPSVVLYGPPSEREHRGRSATDTEEAEEGPFLEKGDEINPPHPPYTPSRRTAYRELGRVWIFGGSVGAECGEWGNFTQYENQYGRARAASAWVTAAGYEDIPDHCRVICGFLTRTSVDDYVWEWLTVTSKINSYFSCIQVDTRDFSPGSQPNPTYAMVDVNHMLNIYLDGKLERSKRKTIVSREITETEQHANDFDEYEGSEITETCRILGGKELEIYEYVELEAATDGWAKIAGNFTWGKLPSWWDGLGISQADLNPRFKIEEIFRRG